ncbi:hypothetical protein [Candidatus Vidania fulgoroideorum]
MIVNLIDQNGIFLRKINLEEAKKKAKLLNKKLVLVNSKSSPITYKLFDQYVKKKRTLQKKIKEINFKLCIHKQDLYVKIRKIIKLLKKKFCVKLIIRTKNKLEENSIKNFFSEIFKIIPKFIKKNSPMNFKAGNYYTLIFPNEK